MEFRRTTYYMNTHTGLVGDPSSDGQVYCRYLRHVVITIRISFECEIKDLIVKFFVFMADGCYVVRLFSYQTQEGGVKYW